MYDKWLSDRSRKFDSSGIRKVFDLGAKLENPINLSIGQPDFDMPQPSKDAAIEAINAGKSGYTPTQGVKPMSDRLQITSTPNITTRIARFSLPAGRAAGSSWPRCRSSTPATK